MASTISAGTTSSTALVATADTSGSLVLQTNNGTTALTLSTAQNATFAGTLATASRGIAAASMPAGTVLQVVSTTKTDTFSTASSTFVDVTGLSVSITPTSSTNKILVFFSVYTSADQNSSSAAIRLSRDSTAIDIGDAAGSRPRISGIFYSGDVSTGTQASIGVASNNFLDSPATTSATTYKIQMASSSGPTMYINRSSADRNTSGYDARTASSITVMEIAA